MKKADAQNLIDDLLNIYNAPNIEIQLPGGQIIHTNDYHHSANSKGELVIVIQAGRKKTKQ